MPSSFKIKDGLARLGVRKPFGVNQDGVHVFECLRILCGTVDLEDKANGSVIRVRHCFLTESRRRLKTNSISEIINVAFDGDITIGDAEAYLTKTAGINANFWARVKGELCLAISCSVRNEHTRAFLHIYRLLEMTSVALPLFYASVESDYYKSLSFLKGLPQNPRDGDLAVFRKFITVLSNQGGFNKLKVKIYFSKGNVKWDKLFAKQVDNYVIKPHSIKAISDSSSGQIDIPFDEFPSFYVTFRNRLFHNTLSTENFDLDRLGGSDLACEPLIKPALNWFTLVLCVILKQNASRFL